MDTRYSPQPEKVTVPLYPSKELFISSASDDSIQELSNALQVSLGCESDQLVVGNSASALTSTYLAQKSEVIKDHKVAIPIFSCQSIVDAVIDSNSTPVFYDIDPDLNVSPRTIEFIVKQECQSFLWPAFFGDRLRDAELIDFLRNADVGIIFDDAQVNPFSQESADTRTQLTDKDISIYSFGMSKLLAGSGGGAFYASVANNFLEPTREKIVGEQSRKDSDNSFEEALQDQQTHWPVSMGLYEDQVELLEARPRHTIRQLDICSNDAAFACMQMEKYFTFREGHSKRFLETRKLIIASLGEKALDFLNGVNNVPTILALKVSSSRRFDLMSDLSEMGVQTTWYYYPINRISRYSRYPSQEDIGSSVVAESVLVLPFQWTHNDAQVNKLLSAIESVGSK